MKDHSYDLYHIHLTSLAKLLLLLLLFPFVVVPVNAVVIIVPVAVVVVSAVSLLSLTVDHARMAGGEALFAVLSEFSQGCASCEK